MKELKINNHNQDAINDTQRATNLLNQLHVSCQYPEKTAIGGGFLWSDGFTGAYTKERNNSAFHYEVAERSSGSISLVLLACRLA